MVNIGTPGKAEPAEPEFVGESVGQPAAVSSFARMLLRLHRQPPLRLVETKPERSVEQAEDETP